MKYIFLFCCLYFSNFSFSQYYYIDGNRTMTEFFFIDPSNTNLLGYGIQLPIEGKTYMTLLETKKDSNKLTLVSINKLQDKLSWSIQKENKIFLNEQEINFEVKETIDGEDTLYYLFSDKLACFPPCILLPDSLENLNWQLNIIRRELLSFNFNSFYNYNSSIEIDEMCISKDINKVDYSCAIEEYLINKYEKEFLRKIHLKNTRQLKIYLSKQNFKLYKRLIKHV